MEHGGGLGHPVLGTVGTFCLRPAASGRQDTGSPIAQTLRSLSSSASCHRSAVFWTDIAGRPKTVCKRDVS
jgi:hypothetical protein